MALLFLSSHVPGSYQAIFNALNAIPDNNGSRDLAPVLKQRLDDLAAKVPSLKEDAAKIKKAIPDSITVDKNSMACLNTSLKLINTKEFREKILPLDDKERQAAVNGKLAEAITSVYSTANLPKDEVAKITAESRKVLGKSDTEVQQVVGLALENKLKGFRAEALAKCEPIVAQILKVAEFEAKVAAENKKEKEAPKVADSTAKTCSLSPEIQAAVERALNSGIQLDANLLPTPQSSRELVNA